MPAVRRSITVALVIAVSAVTPSLGAKPGSPIPDLPGAPASLAPGNDAFSSAVDAGVPQTVAGSNVGATTEEGEPLPCGSIGRTVWYRVTVAEQANVAASTSGSLDTVLAVYRGESLGALELLGCNDDAGWNLGSKVGFGALPGETYYLQVGGYDGEQGGFSLALAVGGAISGVVTGEGGDLGWVCVDLYSAEGDWLEYAYVEGPSAAYRFAGLDAGEYRVGFFDCSDEQRHVAEYYDDAPDLASATPVSVAEGAETAGIDAVLALGGTISGTVTGSGPQPIELACIDIVRPDGSWVAFDVAWDGSYSVGGLAPGDYLVRMEDCWGGSYAPEWWEDADSRLTATPLTIGAGEAVSGIDAELPLAASISGSVTEEATGEPLGGACIQAYDAAGDFAGWGYGDEGEYLVWGLRGDVHLRFQDCADGTHAYEWYDDAPTRAAATAVGTAAGQDTPGIDAALGQAGWIRGRLTNHVGAPIRWACVDVFDATGEWAGWDETGPQGRYTLRGLRGADHRVRFSDCWDGVYREEWWDDATSLASAAPVSVVAGAVSEGIDARLDAPSLIFLQDQGWTGVAEGGAGDRFGVGLGQASSSEISVTLETDGQLTVEPSELSFTAGDQTAREVRVEAVDDDVAEGSHWGIVTLRTSGADPVLGGLVQRFWVSVEDDDLVPAATEVVYEGDTSVARGTAATFAARVLDAETGEGIPWQVLLLRVGNQTYPMFTDQDGYAERQMTVNAPYGTYEVRVSYPGAELYLPSEVQVPFQVAWQHTFEDDLAAGRSVLWNPPTREIRFVSGGDTSAIEQGASSQEVGPLTVVLFQGPSLTVELDWDRERGAFAAVVRTAAGAYVLEGSG